MKSLSRVRLFATPWTVAHQAPRSMKFSRQEYWSGLPFSSPGDLPNPGIEPRSPALQAGALPSESPVASDSFATPWTVAHQAPLLMGFPRQEYWSGLPFPSPRDLPDPGIEPASPALAGGFFTTEPPGKPFYPSSHLIVNTYHTDVFSPSYHFSPPPTPFLYARFLYASNQETQEFK